MLYRTMKRVIERDILKGSLDAEATWAKLDIFFAADRLTQAEYASLTAMKTA